MKLVSFLPLPAAPDDMPHVGVLSPGGVADVTEYVTALPPHRAGGVSSSCLMLRLLSAGPAALAAVAKQWARAPVRPTNTVRLLAPIPRPGKIIAIGRNYADHLEEMADAAQAAPRLIFKLPSSVIGPDSVSCIPQAVQQLDFEVELAAVIGAPAACVSREQALDYVAGYTLVNDLSAREFQFNVSPPQTTFAKSMDGFCPMGPSITTRDEIPDPQSLFIRCHLNGERMQDSSTRNMIHSVADIVAYASQYMTLEPGDLIATGTPAGVGAFRQPPRWLRPGDRLRLEVERLGVLEHGIG